MNVDLQRYAEVVGEDVINHLRQLAQPLAGIKVVHVNSTREGGGVAEILHRLIPLKRELGLDVDWEVVSGDEQFYQCTKSFHNSLQGDRIDVPSKLIAAYEQTNKQNSVRLRDKLAEADVVFIHDPQPAPLLSLIPSAAANGSGAATST
ncbi:MAG: hypothetical protein P9M14_03890 [Candidatus Alcyoniella australis]|nr:hypothetical protein [Candidatus Alcyoniella australis]